MDIAAFVEAFDLGKKAISLLKSIKELMPDSRDKKAAEQMLDQAEKAFKIAEAKAAKELSYELCKCTWPPQIMLRTKDQFHFKCSLCGSEIDKKPADVQKSPIKKALVKKFK